jgi:energy-coupling factor transporter ATP-binding protein EcfA2
MVDLGNGNELLNAAKFNVLLGKNGSGKSTLLRLFDQRRENQPGCVRYITPERGGQLSYDGNIETNQLNNARWMPQQRRKNRFEQFRQSSVGVFRSLETLVLRQIEADLELRQSDFNFDSEVARINELLDRVELVRSDTAGFSVQSRDDSANADVNTLSSGESELVSLAIEIMYFAYLCRQEKYANTDNWLLIDEPDVHLHPDLQHRLMQLIVSAVDEVNGSVLIATHSTAILSSLIDASDDTRVGFKVQNSNRVEFQPIEKPIKAILPMFGAHPLSNIFNQNPPFIVEGEDDERIWQTAVRSSEHRIHVFPCVAGDIQTMNAHEQAANQIIGAVYDNARALSLRDRDEDQGEIEDVGCVRRFRLSCRAAENLLLSDDVLAEMGADWPTLQIALQKWISENDGHPQEEHARGFRDEGWNRKQHPLKPLRMIIPAVLGYTKPWEVAVGRSIARMYECRFTGSNSLREYLGEGLVNELRLEDAS